MALRGQQEFLINVPMAVGFFCRIAALRNARIGDPRVFQVRATVRWVTDDSLKGIAMRAWRERRHERPRLVGPL